jgi:hypothetical protein
MKSIWVDESVRYDPVLRPTSQTKAAWVYNTQWRQGLKWTKTDLLKLQAQFSPQDVQEVWKGEHLRPHWDNLNKNLNDLIKALGECPGLFPRGD